jgi:ankyrin repeat protein
MQPSIFTSARLGKTECIRALIESGRARTTDRDEDDITALHWAAISNRVETCEYLLEHGVNVNATTRTLHATALHWAALQGLPTIVHLLLQHGADARLLDAQGYGSLHAAAHSSSFWCVLLVLCKAGVSPDERDRKGRTALHWAARQQDEVSMRVLLRCGADVNAVDNDGRTALHWAVVGGSGPCVGLLLAAGAELGMRDGERRTARDVADEFRTRDVWDGALAEVGLCEDGTMVRRPLNEVRLPCLGFRALLDGFGLPAPCEHHRFLSSQSFALYRVRDHERVSVVHEHSPRANCACRYALGSYSYF